MFLALLHHRLAYVGAQVVPNQNFDVLLGDAALQKLQEHLLEKGFKFTHVKPPAFIGGEHTSRGCAGGPSVIEVATWALEHGHCWGELPIPTGAEHSAEGRFAMILNLLRVADPFFEETLLGPRIISHAGLIIIEDVGWWHTLNLTLQISKVLPDAGVYIILNSRWK